MDHHCHIIEEAMAHSTPLHGVGNMKASTLRLVLVLGFFKEPCEVIVSLTCSTFLINTT